jgi:DNA polymerase-4
VRPLYDAALRLLRGVRTQGRGVRLVGITAINLTDAEQLTLFDGAADREARLEATVDAVRERFGSDAITRGRLVGNRPARRFDFGEKPAAPPGDAGLDD